MKHYVIAITAVLALLILVSCTAKYLIKNNDQQLNSSLLKDYTLKNGKLTLQYVNMLCEMEIINNGVVHIKATYSNHIPQRHSYAVVDKKTATDSKVIKTNDGLLFVKDDTSVFIRTKSFQADVQRQDKTLYTFTIFQDLKKNKVYVVARYNNERFFGLGEKTGDFELTGRGFQMWNSDTYKYKHDTDPIYASVPFYLAITDDYQYGVFFDSPARSYFNMKADDYSYSVVDSVADFYVFAGEPNSIIGQYSDLTGRPLLPPLYALGFHQSRYSYTNQAQVLSVAQKFHDADIPLEVIYLDIGFMSNNMAFTYDSRKFPSPKKMIAQLKKMGITTVAIVDPGIRVDKKYPVYTSGKELDVYCKYKTRKGKIKDYRGAVWPGMCNFPDYTKPAAIKWWGEQYKPLLDLGVEGFWNDMNEPSVFSGAKGTMPSYVIQDNFGNPMIHKFLHNIYGQTMIEATKSGVESLTDNKRIFILTRSGYAGMQRTAFIWTGDNTSLWRHLKMNLSMAMGLGLSGVPFSGADIGGYTGSPSSELFTRWVQLGAFIPFMRDHTETGTRFQEPYVFEKNIDTIRKYIKLRYKLLPYLYTAVFKTHNTGLPIVKPMFLVYGNKYLNTDKQFMFGDSMLIVPVFDKLKKQKTVDVVIPEGLWYDFHTGDKIKSGTNTLTATIDDIPIYIKAGTILPLYTADVKSTIELKSKGDILLKIYPDKTGSATCTLYEDDGESFDYKKGDYLLSTIEFALASDGAKISIKQEGKFKTKRALIVEVTKNVEQLTYNGKTYKVENGRVVLK